MQESPLSIHPVKGLIALRNDPAEEQQVATAAYDCALYNSTADPQTCQCSRTCQDFNMSKVNGFG